jgi:hypothetical protein
VNCEACGQVHTITGEILVDGAVLPLQYIETIVEVACERGKFRARSPEPSAAPTTRPAFDEPDEGGEQ